jgi:hypothetical protein
MARNKNKNLLLKAKRARAERIDAARLDIDAKITAMAKADLAEYGEGHWTPEYQALLDEQAEIFNEQDEFENNRTNRQAAKAQGKQALREARADAGLATRGRHIEWQEGGRELVPGRSERNATFFGAQEAGLAKVSRDIGRWETLDPYANMRGVSKGEIVMIISEKYSVEVGHTRRKTKSKWAVDIMVGPHVVKGIPAAALRPLEED